MLEHDSDSVVTLTISRTHTHVPLSSFSDFLAFRFHFVPCPSLTLLDISGAHPPGPPRIHRPAVSCRGGGGVNACFYPLQIATSAMWCRMEREKNERVEYMRRKTLTEDTFNSFRFLVIFLGFWYCKSLGKRPLPLAVTPLRRSTAYSKLDGGRTFENFT